MSNGISLPARFATLETMRLLVVEDEPDLLNGLARALRREGYAVDTSATGDEGLYKAQETDYDAIILDVMLPKLDGWEILARLRALIRRAAQKTTSKIVIGDITLDTRARSVMHAGQPVTLTAREFAILEYLALHRGEVISRTELYEHLFDENDDTLSNLVDVHVFGIRKKLGAELIVTRRNQGYCIEK